MCCSFTHRSIRIISFSISLTLNPNKEYRHGVVDMPIFDFVRNLYSLCLILRDLLNSYSHLLVFFPGSPVSDTNMNCVKVWYQKERSYKLIDEVCSVKLNIVCQIDLFDAGKSTGFHMDVQFQLKKNQQPRFDNKCPSADHYSHPPPTHPPKK